MRLICGWAGECVSGDDARRMLRAMHQSAFASSIGEPHIATTTYGALCIDAKESSTNLCERGNCLAAICGNFSWTDAELSAIAKRHGNARALLQGFEKFGLQVATFLSGSFSAVVIGEATNQLLLVNDRTGINSIAYAECGDTVVFGSDAAAIIRHPSVGNEPNPQAFFDYIYFHVIPSPESVYKNVRRLSPGQFAYRKNGTLSTGNYWRVEYGSGAASRSFGDLQQELFDLVSASVSRAARDEGVGTFLSGGVDSSTVTGILRDVGTGTPRAYSIGFDVDDYNELGYARLAAKHFDVKLREYLVTPGDIIEAVPKIASYYAEPFGNSSVVPSYFCAKLAKEDGIHTLLGGDGGDELFGGNTRYAAQKLFAAYEHVPAFLRKHLLEPLFLRTQFGRNFTPVHKVRRYIEQAIVPMPERLQTYNFLCHFPVDQVFEESFLKIVSEQHPRKVLADTYHNVRADSIVDKMLGLDLKFTLADNDLIKVGGACDIAGMEVAYPLLSDELVRFSAQLPSKLKVNGQTLRYFFKKAYSDFLPGEILRKSKHGFGLPFGEWAVSDKNLRSFVGDNLESVKRRHLIRADFVDKLVNSYLPEHPQYYGGIVWLLLMLEQWYQHHQDN